MTSRIKLILYSFLLLAVVVIAYSNHWHNDFHFDDSHAIQNNVYIQHLSNIPLFFKDASTISSLPSNASYRPVFTTSIALDYWFGNGLNPFYFHRTVFSLFLIQGLLMFFFFLKIFETVSTNDRNKFIALFAVAFYMVNPALAETVNYICARTDSISTFFVVMAFVIYQYSFKARKFYLYLIPVLIGSLMKPTAIMFAPMLVVYHILFEEKKDLLSFAKFDWKKLLLVAVPAFVLVVSIYVLIKRKEVSWTPGGYSFFNYVITQPFIYVHYFSQFILPTQLSADTDWENFSSLAEPKAIIGFIFLCCMIFAIFYLSRISKWRPVSFGLSWFLLALVPTTFVPLAEVMNDHRMFYPFIGLSLAAIWTVYLLLENFLQKIPSVALTLILSLILCGYAYGTHTRNEVWKTEETLWNDVSIKSPKNGRGLMNYGLVFMGRASYDTANYYFTKALDYCPNYSLLHVNLAVLKSATGDNVAAETYFKNGIAFGSKEAGNYYFYARFLKNNGRKEEAILNLYSCIRLVDARMDARYMLMPLLYEQKRLEELKTVAKRTLELSPGDATASAYLKMAESGKSQLEIEKESSVNFKTPEQFLNLSLLCYNAGDFEGCISAAQKALVIKPDYPAAYNNICSAYNALNKFEEGVKACEAALKIEPNYALAKGNLSYAKSQLPK